MTAPNCATKPQIFAKSHHLFLIPQDNADPMEDPFAKAIEGKRERVAKNELQRLRNIGRNKNVGILN